MSRLIDLLGERQRFADAAAVPVPTVGFDGLLVVATEFRFVQFQGILLGSFRGVGHIALMRFLDTIDGSDLASSDEDLTEEAAPFLILQPVDGEDLLAVNLSQAEDGLNLIETLPELALVK